MCTCGKNRGRECGLRLQAEQRVGGTFSLQRGSRRGSETSEGERKEKLGLLWEIGLWFHIWKCLCVMSMSVEFINWQGKMIFATSGKHFVPY